MDIKTTDRDIVFFDTETGGLLPSAEMIEIGFVKVRAHTFEIIEEGDIKMMPEHPERMSPESVKLVGYDPEEWKKEAVGRREGIAEFLKHTEGAMLAGHNVVFDRMHLENEMEAHGLPMNFFYKSLDTFVMAWTLLRDNDKFVKFSLTELAPFFGIDQGHAHRAIDDARTTYYVFMKLLELQK
jgi:DNA polymerase III subunit epsilon